MFFKSHLLLRWNFPAAGRGLGLVVLGILCLATKASAGEFQLSTWGVDEGLPQSSVMDVAQTPEGYLWIATLNPPGIHPWACGFCSRQRARGGTVKISGGEFGHVSWERVLSGPGLHNVYKFLRDTNRGEVSAPVADEITVLLMCKRPL